MRVSLPLVPEERPRVRGDCLPGGSNAARPCPWLSCRHHSLEIVEGDRGGVVIAGMPSLRLPSATTGDEVAAEAFTEAVAEYIVGLRDSCTLDVAERHPDGGKLADLGGALDVTRERARQLEMPALRAMRRKARRRGLAE